ncbi:hypothetical protein [Citrobacter freundii]|uniref:hypothetical protein n=1 Tax=Citrobacter freundii TaxID=546 RepID=UPI0024C171CC|nr:hypothetical protein [Citrobacter freundii]WHW81737.1 hypothetical protein PXV97_16140 [Citrobacter freundii]WHW90827.1 hypothetical protein P0S03_16190 [Citrobacter freundii]
MKIKFHENKIENELSYVVTTSTGNKSIQLININDVVSEVSNDVFDNAPLRRNVKNAIKKHISEHEYSNNVFAVSTDGVFIIIDLEKQRASCYSTLYTKNRTWSFSRLESYNVNREFSNRSFKLHFSKSGVCMPSIDVKEVKKENDDLREQIRKELEEQIRKELKAEYEIKLAEKAKEIEQRFESQFEKAVKKAVAQEIENVNYESNLEKTIIENKNESLTNDNETLKTENAKLRKDISFLAEKVRVNSKTENVLSNREKSEKSVDSYDDISDLLSEL